MKKIAFLVMAALMVLVSLAAHAAATNVVANVSDVLQVANAASTPINPFAPLIAGLLQLLTPLAMFLAGHFSHRSGVAQGQLSVK